jgi:hypothetical protein
MNGSGFSKILEFAASARMHKAAHEAGALGGLPVEIQPVFGNFPYPLICPNQYGPLPSDAPNRVLLGHHRLALPAAICSHLRCAHRFPYSKLDANWNYIDQRNQAGRFPAFASLDLKLQYPFTFKFHAHRMQFLGGLKVIDVTNHYNPRDVQQYLGSPNYGVFHNSVGRLWRIDVLARWDIDGRVTLANTNSTSNICLRKIGPADVFSAPSLEGGWCQFRNADHVERFTSSVGGIGCPLRIRCSRTIWRKV